MLRNLGFVLLARVLLKKLFASGWRKNDIVGKGPPLESSLTSLVTFPVHCQSGSLLLWWLR
jgi:hypothetical protein